LAKCLDVVDLPNCIVVDNHQTHVERKDLYNTAKTVLVEASSTTKLLFKIFNEELVKRLNPHQIKLIAMIDDHVAGVNKITASPLLNALYWSYAGDKLTKFTNDFNNGFSKFNIQQKNLITLYFKRLQKLFRELEIFEGNLPFQQTRYRVCAAFATTSYEEISQHLMQAHQADVAIIVNLSTKSVFFKKQKNCTIPLPKLAERMCDGGGGTIFAGGDVTDKFLEFCKTLSKIC